MNSRFSERRKRTPTRRSGDGEGHDPFHTLCKMYGVDRAKDLAKHFGLKVTKAEIERETVIEKQQTEALIAAVLR